MKKEFLEYDLEFDDSPDAQKRIYDILLSWFIKTEMYSGESLSQNDNTYIEAPDLLAEIADKGFSFKYTNKG